MDKAEIRAIIKSSKDHRKIKQIMNMRTLFNFEISKDFSFINLVTTNKIKQLLQSLNAKTTVGIKSIQHKLVKLVDVMRCAILDQTLTNGVPMFDQNTILTS